MTISAVYETHMGDDLMVANAARVSFGKRSQYIKEDCGHSDCGPECAGFINKLSKTDKDLIQFLARGCMSGEWNANISILASDDIECGEAERILKWAKNMPTHWTPFSHPQITIVEKVPIFIARQRFKHMIGFTYNEVSRRYVDDEPEFYAPSEWRSRPEGSVKQGSGGVHKDSRDYCVGYERYIDQATHDYNKMIADGVAPEQARMVLPQSMLTEYWVTGSLYAWANAYIQRSDSHAQLEIQELAKQWDKIIRPLFPESWSALVD